MWCVVFLVFFFLSDFSLEITIFCWFLFRKFLFKQLYWRLFRFYNVLLLFNMVFLDVYVC